MIISNEQLEEAQTDGRKVARISDFAIEHTGAGHIFYDLDKKRDKLNYEARCPFCNKMIAEGIF